MYGCSPVAFASAVGSPSGISVRRVGWLFSLVMHWFLHYWLFPARPSGDRCLSEVVSGALGAGSCLRGDRPSHPDAAGSKIERDRATDSSALSDVRRRVTRRRRRVLDLLA